MTIGERIKQRRLELGLTQTELAQRLGLKSKVSVSTVENDREDLTTDRIRKFAEALETTPGYLMGWNDTLPSFTYKGGTHNPDVSHVFHMTVPGSAKTTTTTLIQKVDERRRDAIIDYASIISALLANKHIVRLMLAAQNADPDQIEMAINLLNYKKENK